MAVKETIFLLVSILCFTDCANILCVFNMASISHQIVYQPIWKELSLRGHQVTVITPNPLNDPTLTNLTEIDVGPLLYQRVKELNKKFAKKPSHWILTPLVLYGSTGSLDIILTNPEVVALLGNASEKFDVVLAEYGIPIGSAFAEKFKCPLVGVMSLKLTNMLQAQLGIPNHPVLYPEVMAPYGANPDFFGRVKAVLNDLFLRLFYNYVMIPRFDNVVKKYFGNDFPYYGDVERNVSVLLVNSNPIIHGARPLGPNVVELGRMHIKNNTKLPQDLQKYLDDATEGVIYFSLGSNVKSALLDANKRKIIIQTFVNLPYKVLWKFEEESIGLEVPPNVLIRKWFPQQAVLAHTNVKLFISQGGLQSTEEAIVSKVPIVAIPFIFDQFYNAKKIEELGIGRLLYFEDLNEDNFKERVVDVLSNPRYKQTITEVSEAMTDEPMNGLQKAVFWVEYVIRHKGAKYLASPLKDIPWFKFLLLDVIIFLSVTSLVLSLVVYKVSVLFLRLCCKRSKEAKLKTG